jgi:hypothetical protein
MLLAMQPTNTSISAAEATREDAGFLVPFFHGPRFRGRFIFQARSTRTERQSLLGSFCNQWFGFDTRQLAAAALKATPLLAEEAKANLKVSPGRGDAKTFVKNDKPLVEPIHARVQVAKQFNVSEGSIHAVKKIAERSPETFEKVAAGELTPAPERVLKGG